jgi:hypothetical protein
MKPENRLTNEEIKARLVLIVGIGLTASFLFSVVAMLYGLLFVVQPTEMAELDQESFKTLNPMLMTLSGALVGLLAANGLRDSKDKPKDPPSVS